jgi:glycosyltransferase involved in cell wall biosynthesis
MRVLLDPQIFNQQKYGGISRYYTEIFSRLSKEKDVQVILPFFSTHNFYLKESPFYSKYHKRVSFVLNIFTFLGVSLRKNIKKQNSKLTIKALESNDFDILIATYYDTYFLKYLNDKPFVLTVYDMIHELFPHYFNDDTSTVSNKLLLMEKASKIIAVSENTKKDIVAIYPHIDESKIEVIYHGSSIKINDVNLPKLPGNYLLFVGVRSKYKNFIFLINSIQNILKNNPNLYLICAGGGKFSKEELELIKSLELENQIQFRAFKENELGQIYKNAICFVFPSLYEGFGIPILEAMACGCPVVLTNNSSFPEIAANAGIYFELNNSESLSSAIENLLRNKSLQKEYSSKGYKRIQDFEWDKAAVSCLKLYKNSISN